MTIKKYHIVIAALVILAVQAAVLYWLGHPAICRCGYVKIWDSVVKGPQNSQHLFDWYSFSHIISGFVIYFFLWLANKKLKWPVWYLLLVALLISTGWELFENTHFALSRFQHATIYTNYYGDSIINSLSDTVCVGIGFLLARRLPVSVTIILAVVMELVVGGMIHDNLTLNTIMLIHPFASILKWQGALSP